MDHQRNILVTSALPYANGEIHLGHLLEYIQTDIWVRFQKLRGHTCYYICADDAHGTPIMLRAQQEGIEPEALIARVHDSHTNDFDKFHIAFDNYHSTHSDENRHYSNQIFAELNAKGYIAERSVQQAYDEQAEMFLPDRFIRGECPKCGAKEQYGDCCEVCGAIYTPEELLNPTSVLSGTTPVRKDSNHLFFQLAKLEEALKRWMTEADIQDEISNKLQEWFEEGLKDWDISRDAPYFGFEIEGYPGKYFYVWLDAPIGYIASFKNFCEREGVDFEQFWGQQSPAELHHFIGKDIAYFHSLFWPAMLLGVGWRVPSAIHCHGFVTVNGQKMSKSRNTFITAKTYLEHIKHPDYLRYYFAAHITNKIEDIDLNTEDFRQRVNSDLVGKFVNIASRCASFIHKHFGDEILCGAELLGHELYQQSVAASEEIAQAYESLSYAQAMRKIMALADEANRYIDAHKPWQMAKQDGATDKLHEVCSIGILLFARLSLYLSPVLPSTCEQCAKFLNIAWQNWQDDPFAGKSRHTLQQFKPLLKRIEPQQTEALTSQS